MLNIEIKGVQFSNKGAELMLVAILEQLDQALEDYEITLAPGRLLPYSERAKLGAWQKLSFRRGKVDLTGVIAKLPHSFQQFLSRYGIVSEKQVDVILDASGFAYGEQWGVNSLYYTANEVARYKKSGKKYIFLPQALGPFNQTPIRELARKVFSQANLVFPRDQHSNQAVNDVVAQSYEHIQQMPDFTCLVEPEPFSKYQNPSYKVAAKSVCLIPNNKMISKFSHAGAERDAQSYLDFFINVAKYYQDKGWQVVLLNHEGKEDQALCVQIQLALNEYIGKETIEIVQGLSAVDIKAFIGSVDAVVSSRFHGCVSALTQGIPCLATSWSHKYQMLFDEYGLIDNVLDFKLSKDELMIQLDNFTSDLAIQKVQCLDYALKVKEDTRNMWKQVFSLLHSINKS